MMMQAMADSYSKEYEKLKVENKDLKDELSTVNQKRRSLELRQQKETSSGATSPVIVTELNMNSVIERGCEIQCSYIPMLIS